MPRPKGTPKTGGRVKGKPNRASVKRQTEVAATGETPLDYLLGVMRNTEGDPAIRLDAAKAAAPYVHPKLAAIEHAGPEGGPIQIEASWGESSEG